MSKVALLLPSATATTVRMAELIICLFLLRLLAIKFSETSFGQGLWSIVG